MEAIVKTVISNHSMMRRGEELTAMEPMNIMRKLEEKEGRGFTVSKMARLVAKDFSFRMV